MPPVTVKSGLTYDYGQVRDFVFGALDACGCGGISRTSRVVIKPNLLAPAPPGKAMLTHPMVVRAAAEYVISKGAVPQISDSPAMGTFERVLKESGISGALAGMPVEFREFRESVTVETGEPFKKLELAADAVRADFLINLPKLKTHQQMLLTLGVKNLFGCVVGLKKPEWHFRAGTDRELFAKLLVQIWAALRPSATILDGVLAMEGQGPGKSGTPRELGVMMASPDAAALDIAVCRMLGIAPERLFTNGHALRDGLVSGEVAIHGEMPLIKDFRLPDITPLVFGPRALHGIIRGHFVQRPEAGSACLQCGECWKYCPAGAITKGKKKVEFDYDKCIRCYCCIEVCPHAALKAKETLPGKIARRFIEKNLRGRKRK